MAMTFRLVLILIITSILTFTVESQSKYFVKDGGVGPDGLSWTNAFGELQQAIDATMAGDTIWVAKGVYMPTVEFDEDLSGGADAQEKTIYINKNIHIYGGFIGTESLLSERDFVNNLTVLSGEIGTPSDSTDNVNHVIYIDTTANMGNITENFDLDGFTITNGNTGLGLGGGIYINGSKSKSTPVIRNCIFRNNSSEAGGAIFNDGTGGEASPTIDFCSFYNNSSSIHGGAVYNFGQFGISSPTITNSHFESNKSELGGAIHNDAYNGASNTKIINSVFIGNTAGFGGAIYSNGYLGSNTVTITNSTFYHNFGMNWKGTVRNNFANAIITNSILWDIEEEIVDQNGTSTVSYSIVKGGHIGTANKNVYPLFIDTLTNNLRLLQSSPAINMGTPVTTDLDLSLVDIDQRPRLNGVIDIGAYENPFVNCPLSISITPNYSPLQGCYAAQSMIELNGDLLIQPNMEAILKSPQIIFNPGFNINGGTLTINNSGCP